MKEIKSVRVRRKFSSTDENLNGLSDYKVILYDNGRNKFKVSAGQIGRVFLNSEYIKEGRYKNFSNDEFIKDGINVLISKQNSDKEFEIIQDPWLDKPPKWRSFGFTPYYLNNGAEVTIQWLSGTTSAGGKKWSDDDGKELSTSKDGESKSFIDKVVTIWAPESYKGQNKRLKITQLGIEGVIDKEGNPLPFADELKYSGNILDKDIINNLISIWNIKVPNYNLSLCDPDYIKCEIIPYISPVDELVNIEENLEEPVVSPTGKEKLNVVLPKYLNLKVKQDISFKIFVGDPPKTNKPVDGFDFSDEDDLSDLLLEDEFRETDFAGLEDVPFEIREELQNIDNTSTSIKTETLSVDYKDTRFIGGNWKKYEINNLITDIKSTKHGPSQKFTESLKKILLWIKQDKDITDIREASYLLATAYAESGYSLQRWEADYICSGQGIPYGPNGPCSSALSYFRSSKGKKDYYTLGIDSRGFPYFGRGLIQLTGKSNYESYGKRIGVNLVSNGDLALKEDNSYKISVIYLVARTFKHVKNNDLTKARKSVNGGIKGINEVNSAYNDWLRIFKKYTEQEAIV